MLDTTLVLGVFFLGISAQDWVISSVKVKASDEFHQKPPLPGTSINKCKCTERLLSN